MNFITVLCRQQVAVIQIDDTDDSANIRNTGQSEATRRKYKRLKLSGGLAYNISSDLAAIIA
jgi:hypothetical protein